MSKQKKNSKTYKYINEIAKDIYEKSIYLYGKDIFIANDILKNIINKNFNAGIKELNVKKIDGKKAKPEDIINEINVLPVFDKYKFIIVENSVLFEKNSKSDASKVNELIKLLKDKPDYLLIVFISHDLPYWSNSLFEYFKNSEAAYELDGCDIKDDFIKKWLIKKAEDINFEMDGRSADYFLSYVGYYGAADEVNAEILYNELNKLSCYCADKKSAEEEDIKKICASYMPESIDILIKALNSKNLPQASSAFNQLLKNNIYPTVILNAIVSNFNIMLLYKQHSVKIRLNAWDMLARIKKMQSIKYASHASVENIIKNSGNFTDRKIKSIIYTCAKYDNGVKSGIIEADIGLERILYFICT